MRRGQVAEKYVEESILAMIFSFILKKTAPLKAIEILIWESGIRLKDPATIL